jgi:hypothetical protein
MITILLPAFAIASGCLQMTISQAADPDIFPRRRYGESLDSRQLPRIVDYLVANVAIDKPISSPAAAKARESVVDVSKGILCSHDSSIE